MSLYLGNTSQSGTQGPRGRKGATGATGSIGMTGPTGSQGPTGTVSLNSGTLTFKTVTKYDGTGSSVSITNKPYMLGSCQEICYTRLSNDSRLSYSGASPDIGAPQNFIYYYHNTVVNQNILFTPSETFPAGIIEVEYQVDFRSNGGIANIQYSTDGVNYITMRSLDYYAPNYIIATFKDYFYLSSPSSTVTLRWLNNGKNTSSTNYTIGIAQYLVCRSIT